MDHADGGAALDGGRCATGWEHVEDHHVATLEPLAFPIREDERVCSRRPRCDNKEGKDPVPAVHMISIGRATREGRRRRPRRPSDTGSHDARASGKKNVTTTWAVLALVATGAWADSPHARLARIPAVARRLSG